MNRDNVIELLEHNTHIVEFTKLNGERRVMTCTLDPKLLPHTENSSGSPDKRPPENIVAWDVNASGWRTFKLDRVITIDNSPVDYEKTELDMDTETKQKQNRIDISIGDV